MKTLFHITTAQAWEKARNQQIYSADSLEQEGFIHFSCPHQILNTAELFFKNKTEKIMLLQIAEEKLTSPVKYEGENNILFPHLYGPLNTEAVLNAWPFEKINDVYELPEEFQMIGETLIRSAVVGDEAEIANVHIHSWLQSYPGIVPDQVLKKLALSFRQRRDWWGKTLKNKTPVFVAESREHGIVAFSSIDSARDKEFAGYGEITTLYCLDEYKGLGIGRALFQRALSALRKLNYDRAYLWVLEDNPTRRTYLKWHGQMSGKQKIVEFAKPLVHVAIEWNLKETTCST